ncbi:MAG: RdgB/HAM1 family non-canonical purine NTP pyrophosphatase [Coriobacteriia bacterium]|nr:RdgB/HAM1 family non-canonical purine NTP pyrophosphatase [Coriobacteriia bacterium]
MSPNSEGGGGATTAGQAPMRVVVATGNRHKVEEIRAALAFTSWEFVAAADLGGWPEPEETGETFEENARIKALAASETYGLPALADDSGLEVDALDGEPGVYSSRYAGSCATDAENNARLLLALGDTPRVRREARFRSVIVLVREDGSEVVAEGVCEGHIGTEPRGEHGFGYDPLFWPDATPGRTMAELPMAEKNAISHRGAALRALHDLLEAVGE